MDKTKKKKKQMMMTRRKITRITGLVILGLLVVATAAYLFIDSKSYVATVQGQRVIKYEYQYFLYQQKSQMEQNAGLTGKAQTEIDAFWKNAGNGQNQWETAKNQALGDAQKYAIQMIKANESGLKVDSSAKSNADQALQYYKQSGGWSDAEFPYGIKALMGISLDELRKLTENLYLVDEFRTKYIKDNYKPVAITDKEVQDEYGKDPKKYDTVDFTYTLFMKKDNSGKLLSGDDLTKVKSNADEALKQINTGADTGNVYSAIPGSVTGFFTNSGAGQETTPGKVTAFPYVTGMGSGFQTFVDYLFNNTVGSSGVVETDDYYIAVKIDKRTALDDVKASIRTTMENTNEFAWYKDQLNQWAGDPKYNVKKNNPVYDSISYK